VPELGKVTVDVAWGGMFYVIADAAQFPSLELVPDRGRDITRISSLILRAAQDQLPVEHPDYPGIGITISQLSGVTDNPKGDPRNAVTVASGPADFNDPATWTGGVDRCPCGIGTCARMATLHAKGELPLSQPFRHEGVLGTVYTGELVEEVEIAGRTGWFPKSAARPGSPDSATGSLTPRTSSPTATPSAIFGHPLPKRTSLPMARPSAQPTPTTLRWKHQFNNRSSQQAQPCSRPRADWRAEGGGEDPQPVLRAKL
jgi:hypothetical protein